MKLEIWCKIGLSGGWCLCTALRTRSGACYYWIGLELCRCSVRMSRFAAIQCDSPSANCTDEASDRWSRRVLRGQTDWPRAADEKPNQLNSTTLGWNRNSVRSAAATSDAAKRKRFIVVGVGSEPSSASSVLFLPRLCEEVTAN